MALPAVYAGPCGRSVGNVERVDIGAKTMARNTSGGFGLEYELCWHPLGALDPFPYGGAGTTYQSSECGL